MENSQKLEDILNLALDVSKEELAKSPLLGVGYDTALDSWELIVKYNGSIERLNSGVIKVELLISNYAIVTIRSDLIPAFSLLEEIEYIEAPKRLYFE